MTPIDATQGARTLEVIVFPNTTVLPLYVGIEKRLFEREGLRVNITVTPTSTYQMTELYAGTYHIAIGAFDNIVAYQEGQGAVVLDGTPDLFAFMGVAQMNLQLVVQPDIRSYADLKGKTFAVDAPSSGFVYVLRRMLELGGLSPDDYTLVAVGTRRWDSMRAGEHAGALMTDNYMAGDLSKGLKVLENSIDVLPGYQSAVGSARRSWASANRDTLVAFIRAYVDCLDWIFAPANRGEAARILAANRQGMSAEAAGRAVAQLVADREGLIRGGRIVPEGVRTVIELRNRYGEPRKALPAPEAYIDLSYYDAAMLSRTHHSSR